MLNKIQHKFGWLTPVAQKECSDRETIYLEHYLPTGCNVGIKTKIYTLGFIT